MSHFDVIIVGGGIAGASLGSRIAGRQRTLIIEAEDQCGYHSTGRSAAFYLESYGGPEIAKLSKASRSFLKSPPTDFAQHGFLRTRGDLHLTKDDLPELPPSVETRVVEREELEQLIPGIKPPWRRALLEPGCADIDVASLHAGFLRRFRQQGGTVATASKLAHGHRSGGTWLVTLTNGNELYAPLLVNSAGAWADRIAAACGVAPLGVTPKRRTMVQLRVGRSGLRDLPLVDDANGTFYFKGEGDRRLWLSPHDEIESQPCDAAPEEIDIAIAIERLSSVVEWPIECVERSWAGLRSFARDRLPIYGYSVETEGFFWCAGQGGFGIQTSPAAAMIASAVLLGDDPASVVPGIDASVFAPSRFIS